MLITFVNRPIDGVRNARDTRNFIKFPILSHFDLNGPFLEFGLHYMANSDGSVAILSILLCV